LARDIKGFDASLPADQRTDPFERFKNLLLPLRLNDYACWLDTIVEPVYRQAGSFRGYGSDDIALAQLVCYVEELTGRPHYKELGALLEAAKRALGAEKENYYDPGTLQQKVARFEKRYPQEFRKAERRARAYITDGNGGWSEDLHLILQELALEARRSVSTE
jgi:hypothetical protein